MRGETVQKRKLEGREKGNEEAVEGMRREARGAVAGSDSDDSNPNNRQGNEDEDEDEDEDEEDGVNAPWAGTSLHKLMAPIEKKNLTSLTGLQGIQSHTRAAKGYAKPDVGASPRKTLPQPISKTKRIEVQSARPKKVEFTTSRVVPQASGSSRGWQAKPPSVSASPDSSDLDALPPPRSKSSNPPASVSSKPSDPLTLAASDLFHPFQHRSRPHQPDPSSPPKILPSHYHHRRPNPNPELDNNNDDEEAVAAAAARRRLQMRRDREATVKKKGGMGMGARGRMDVKGNVDEIPVFLV